MADYTIDLNVSETRNYVSDAQFALQAKISKTVRFHAVGANFTVTIRNADRFFVGQPSLLIINIDSTEYSKEYTIKDLLLGNEQEYFVYCVDNRDPGDSPPKIIIVPGV